MNERCGNCKHWGTTEDAAERFRVCQAVIHDKCGAVDADEFNEFAYPSQEGVKELKNSHKAVVHDGSGYFAALKVREDFGCVLFEKAGEE